MEIDINEGLERTSNSRCNLPCDAPIWNQGEDIGGKEPQFYIEINLHFHILEKIANNAIKIDILTEALDADRKNAMNRRISYLGFVVALHSVKVYDRWENKQILSR